ncbi:MAG: acyl transferase [Bacteroidota bacterium]
MSPIFNIESFADSIFKIRSIQEFNGLSLELFHYQCRENKVYAEYLAHLGRDVEETEHYNRIPFLPIAFYKLHKIVSGNMPEDKIFLSSGTGGMQSSKHYILDLALYRRSFMEGFESFYGDPASYVFLGLLPSYLEREGSSLVYMIEKLMEAGKHEESGFFLNEHDRLAGILKSLSSSGKPAILIGVSFALLDFAESQGFSLGDNIIIMETGGMKGRREEITREDLHKRLQEGLHTTHIHSEYGMTELLSQAYSKGSGRFYPPPWMKILIRDIQDPFTLLPPGRSGAINIIDLANIHSCAFIETQDIGRLFPDGSFEVLGRTDTSDIRGCSLLIS